MRKRILTKCYGQSGLMLQYQPGIPGIDYTLYTLDYTLYTLHQTHYTPYTIQDQGQTI